MNVPLSVPRELLVANAVEWNKERMNRLLPLRSSSNIVMDNRSDQEMGQVNVRKQKTRSKQKKAQTSPNLAGRSKPTPKIDPEPPWRRELATIV